MTLTTIHTPIGTHTASALRLSDTGAPLHFYHANGFGARAYLPFLEKLTPKYNVSALNMRALWPSAPIPDRKIGWHQYAHDLVHWLEATQSEPVIGVGHSMGAVATAIAANLRPDLFRALVLIEPTSTTFGVAALLKSVPYDMRKYLGPLKTAMRSQTEWRDADEMLASLRLLSAYKRFGDKDLRALIDATTVANDKGITLAYSPHWENHNYFTAGHNLPELARLKVPSHIIATKPSFFVSPAVLIKLRSRRPDIGFSQFLENGHLMPLEAPDDAADAVVSALEGLL